MITVTDLEARWKTINYAGIKNYRSLLLSSDSIPDLYIGKDITGSRFLILEVPKEFNFSNLYSVVLENLTLNIQASESRILIGLRNPRFSDLFNDLVLSLYYKVKSITRPEDYVFVFTDSFAKWSEFFEVTSSDLLSKEELQGLFGELLVFRYFLKERIISIEDLLFAWQGPYGKPQDFVFSAYNLEVKTRDTSQVTIHISSEYQLQPEVGKDLQLAVVTVQENSEGLTIETLYNEIRALILASHTDISLFLKTLLKAGISTNNFSSYNEWRWQGQQITLYNCSGSVVFPKIITSQIQEGISKVKYHLALSVLDDFVIQTITL